MKLEWNELEATGDLGSYEIVRINGDYVSHWKPSDEKGYRAYSSPVETIEEAQEISQVMEDDMTGLSLITNERWEAFLKNSDEITREVYSHA